MSTEKTRAEKTLETIMSMSLEEIQKKLAALRQSKQDVESLLLRFQSERERLLAEIEDMKSNKTSSAPSAKLILLKTERIQHLTRMIETDLQMLKSLQTMERIYMHREAKLLKNEANKPTQTLLKKNN
ncbi:MAG: hypothetical protein EBU82_09920, partial [Flavobacteriia bacterium]|nr:hypothetical protein [Flavobacteriia bacterium]